METSAGIVPGHSPDLVASSSDPLQGCCYGTREPTCTTQSTTDVYAHLEAGG